MVVPAGRNLSAPRTGVKYVLARVPGRSYTHLKFGTKLLYSPFLTSNRLRVSARPESIVVLLTAAIFLLFRPVSAQTANLSGVVTDPEGSPVPTVAVSLTPLGTAGSARTTLTDSTGRYRIENISPGRYAVRAQRIGFEGETREIALQPGESATVHFELVSETIEVPEIVVETRVGRDRERERFETQPGVTARVVEVASVRLLPGLAEPDVLRAMTMLPGVISTSDYSSAFNVRGGSADQNLVTIDGFTVFNPFHLGGLFSVFNTDAIERAELFSGGFGAEYGGRVSSVLNIESRSDVPLETSVSGGVSLLATRLLFHGPIAPGLARWFGGERGSWFVSGRRSYFDQVLRPVSNFPYHLTDLQGHASVFTPGGGRLSLTMYWGEDVLDLSGLDLADEETADVLRVRWNWGNRVLGFGWTQPFADAWLAETRIGYSQFADQLGFVDFGDVDLSGRIEQLRLSADFNRDADGPLSIRLGTALERTDHRNLAEAGGTNFFSSEGGGLLGSLYTSLRWRPGEWIIEPGVRGDVWTASGARRSVMAPRLAVKRFLDPGRNLAAKIAIGRYAQFVHSLRDEELLVSNDTWILADANIPHVISDQVQLGIETFRDGGWSASVEAYARTFRGVTDFNHADDPNDPTDDLLHGSGTARGLDFMIRKDEGRLTGWAALSLLKAERTFPDPFAAGTADVDVDVDVVPEVTFPPIFDRRLNLDLVAQYTTPGNVEIGLRWNFGSALPYTRPLAQHFAWRYNPILGGFEPFDSDSGDVGDGNEDENGLPVQVVMGPRNSERYPHYHRLDLTIRRRVERSWGSYVPYLQILNAYNRRNVLFYFFNYDESPPVRSGISMFPLLPAIGVEVSF